MVPALRRFIRRCRNRLKTGETPGTEREVELGAWDLQQDFLETSPTWSSGSRSPGRLFCHGGFGTLSSSLSKVDGDEPSAFRAGVALAQSFFLGVETGRRAIMLSITLIIVLLVESAVFILYSNVQKTFMTSLQEKDAAGFYGGLWKTGGIIVFVSPIIAAHEFLAGVLKMEWRKTLTERLAKSYLIGQNVFYRLGLTGEIDNPDQRICQDVHDYVETTFGLFQDSIGTIFNTLGFAGVLFRISPTVCFSVIIYALFGTLVSAMGFGPWLMYFQNENLRQEADMRYCFIRVRENSESIAFFKGGEAEYRNFTGMFDKLLHTVYRSIVVHTGFGVFSRTFHWATFMVAPLTVGPAYLRGEAEFGAIAQAAMAFGTILAGLTLIMSKMEAIASFSVRVKRLHALDEALQRERARVKATQLTDDAGGAFITSMELPDGSPIVLQVRDLTLRTPPRKAGGLQQTLAQCLSMRLSVGQTLLITGESGIGKSSLLRAVAGLWSDGAGRIEICGGDSVFFLPQKPYMFIGTLREQLLYPEIDRPAISHGALEEALAKVRLDYILKQHSLWDSKDWSNILSLGEQQRINFARVLLKPTVRLVLIDEGTSACDSNNETRLYQLLHRNVRSFISVGHRPALQNHHSHALWLQRPQDLPGQTWLADGPAHYSFMSMAEYQEALASKAARPG